MSRYMLKIYYYLDLDLYLINIIFIFEFLKAIKLMYHINDFLIFLK